MRDPLAVFRADPRRQDTLKALWPDLYACLSVLDKPPAATAARPCQMAAHRDGHRPPAVARLSRHGYAACAACVQNSADRPGGWPLDLREHGR
jgi:hypothetical protein